MNKNKKKETAQSIAEYISRMILANGRKADSLNLTGQSEVETGFVDYYGNRFPLRRTEGTTASFGLQYDYETETDIPARKVWRVVVECIDDSTIAD